ncbi:MAG TPA: PP2C family protein-serine/threonine phosphatase [Syntrophorhabdaceae bacterium]|jgi:sigma-B regulation protein RsbU (phosphoserine phosphatase)
MTGSLNLLAFYARQLSYTDFTDIHEAGARIKAIAMKSKDEVSRLAKALAFMTGSLTSHIEKLKEATAAKEKIESELKIAHDIQMSMVPHPPELARHDFELAAHLEPAKEVGGDFYDFFFTGSRHLWIVIGDVSGKGVPAALCMARGKTAIRLLAAGGQGVQSPSEILSKANVELCRENDQVMFITVFLAVLDMETGELRYSNAGHNPPYLINAAGTATRVDVRPGRPLGVRPAASFCDEFLVLPRGGLCFAYTDGVTEAMDPEGALFGEEGLAFALEGGGATSPREHIMHVLAALRRHAAGAVQSDDITILSVRFLGPAT